jgi:hypothetical protein
MALENVASVCAHGHVATKTIRYSGAGTLGLHCAECGALTIQSCPSCDAPIPGGDPMNTGEWVPPAFCISCGAGYPWTEERLSAARESIELLEGLSHEERDELRASLDALVVDTPRTQVAALKAKRLIAKAGGPAVGALVDGLRSFAVAAAMKILFP